MTSSPGLIAFLTARLDEDETVAKYALEKLSACAGVRISDPGDGGDIGHMVAYSVHAHRHGPARALREVEAKRAIMAEHKATSWETSGGRLCGRCINPYDLIGRAPHEWVYFPCPTLRQLAAVYSGHPDYRQEWAS